MIALVIYIFCVFVALACAVMAAVSDFKHLKIPNSISVLVIVSFAICFLAVTQLSQVDIFYSLKNHLIAGFATFAVTFILYAVRVFGAGDAKLLTAFAFWVGLQGLPALLMIMGITGGILALMSIILKKIPLKSDLNSHWIATIRGGKSAVPYGIAIAAGAFAAFWTGGFLSIDVLKDLLV